MLTLRKEEEKLSLCCRAKIFGSLGDGVIIGTCSTCGTTVCRVNPRTGRSEWLNGASPWTTENAPDRRQAMQEELRTVLSGFIGRAITPDLLDEMRTVATVKFLALCGEQRGPVGPLIEADAKDEVCVVLPEWFTP